MESNNKGKDFCMFALPGLFCFVAVVIVPFVYGVYLTLTDWNGVSMVKNFVGLKNFAGVMRDGQFWTSLLLTFKYVIVVVLLVNVLAFGIAYLLTRGMKGQNFFRAGFFTPNLIGGIVLGYIWSMIFDGILKRYGTYLLAETKYGFWGLIILMCWQQIGYMMIVYIAGLQSVGEDMLEAAKIDGANKWQTLIKIIIPNVMSSITICVFLTLTNSFKLFDQNLALTEGMPVAVQADGSMINTTEMLALNIFKTFYASANSRGVAQAKAVMFFVLVAVLALAQLRFTRNKEVQQ